MSEKIVHLGEIRWGPGRPASPLGTLSYQAPDTAAPTNHIQGVRFHTCDIFNKVVPTTAHSTAGLLEHSVCVPQERFYLQRLTHQQQRGSV